MNPTIVITGASAGIGAAVAKHFSKENYQLVLLARRKEKLEALQKELGKHRTHIFSVDISSREAVERTFATIAADLGAIDILVNNAGVAFGLDRAQEANLDEWETCVEVNINGLIYCTHAALPGMIKNQRGHIINLGSVAGHYPYPGGSVYCGTKAFVHKFSLCLRADLLGTPVRVTCIEPGLLEGTEFSTVRFRGDEEKAKRVYERTKALSAEDVARVIHFCVHLPPHVNINTIELMPVAQAFAPLSVHRSDSI